MRPLDALRRWWNTPSPPEGRITAMLLLVLAAPLAWYYFVAYETSNHFERDAPTFYRAVKHDGASWLKLSDETIAAGLRSGTFKPFPQQAVRTALVRWRHREKFPLLWESLMRDYASGLWKCPPRQRWEELFSDADQRWIAARLQSGPPNIQAAQVDKMDQDRGVRIRFPAGTPTSKVGSMITVVEEVAADAKPPAPIAVYWSVNGESIRADRFAQSSVSEGARTADGRRTFIHTFDFSAEPAWIASGAMLSFLELRGPGLTSRIASVNALDSPLLKP